MHEIGTIISNQEGSNSNEFWFVLHESKGVPVRKGQFIQLNTQDGILVARVEEIIKVAIRLIIRNKKLRNIL